MSELVKKVGYAVDNVMSAWAANHSKLGAGRWDVPDDVIARAAIKAVAEWLNDNADEENISSSDLITEQLKEPKL